MTEKEMPFLYSRNGDGITITAYLSDEESVDIPETIEGLPVTGIGSYAFYEHGTNIRRIHVPGCVKTIMPHAFELCIGLDQLILDEGVEELGEDALLATAVRNLYIPSTVRRIRSPGTLPARLLIDKGNPRYSSDGYGIYEETTLVAVDPDMKKTQYSVREGTAHIAMGVFENRPWLKSVHLPASLKTAAEGVFSNVRNQYSGEKGIRDVTVDPNNPVFLRDEHALCKRLEGGLSVIRWFGDEEELDLPDRVTEIGREAFALCRLRIVTFPEGLERIRPDAFRGCPLKEARTRNGEFGVVFPGNNPYLLKDLLAGFGRNNSLYDFSRYDQKLEEWYPDPGRCHMMLGRLRMPYELSGENRSRYRTIIETHLYDILSLAARDRDMELLQALAEEEFFDEKSIDYAFELFNREGLSQMAAYALHIRHLRLDKSDFDYSL